MKLQLIVSTMFQDDLSLVDKMKISSEAIIINQCNKNQRFEFFHNNNRITWINTSERGLSNSRNMGLKNASGDICVLADDDLEYIDNYEKIILNEFERYSNVDIITFQVYGIEKKFKSYSKKKKKLNFISTFKVSSVEIAFKLNSIKNAGIQFNEYFGAGSKFIFGEENIFLSDCIKKGLKIMYVPVKIADLHVGNSTWFKGFNEEYFISRGASFTAMSKTLSILLILQFAIRKYKLYKKSMPMVQAIRYMLKGRKQFLDIGCDD